MNTKNRKAIIWLPPVILVALFVVLHEFYVTRAHPDAVYMDTLRVIYQLKQWQSGHMSFLTIWGLGLEHHGFINQAFVMANIKLFSLNVLLANRLTGFVIFLLTLTVLMNLHSDVYKISRPVGRNWLMLAIVSVVVTLVCFSWAGFELLTLNLGLSQWVKNFVFILYFVAHSSYLNKTLLKSSSVIGGLALGIAGAIIILMIAMGWSYAFLGAITFVYVFSVASSIVEGVKRIPLVKFMPLALLLAAQGLYVVAGTLGPSAGAASHPRFAAIGRVPDLILYALGSGTIGQETLDQYSIRLYVAAVIGAISLALAILALFFRFRRRDIEWSRIPLYLIAYGFLVALSVSIARGSVGPRDVMASRYYLDLMLFYVGLIWVWYELLLVSTGNLRVLSGIFFCAFLVVVVLAQGLTYKREWGAAPYRALSAKAMNRALENGVPDQASAELLQSPLVYARLADQIMLEDHLALYADLPEGVCRPSGVGFLAGWYQKEATGIWMGKHATLRLPACHCTFIADVFVPSNFGRRSLQIGETSGKSIDLRPGSVETVRIGPSGAPRLLDLAVSEATIPANLPGAVTRDERSLGAFWASGFNFACRPQHE